MPRRDETHFINGFVHDAGNAGNGAVPLVGLRDAVKRRLEAEGMTCRRSWGSPFSDVEIQKRKSTQPTPGMGANCML